MKNKELFMKRLKITMFLLVIYYLLALIPVPFLSLEGDSGGQFLSTIASINGATNTGLKLFSLGLMPYFMSTLTLKVLTQGISATLSEWSKGTQDQRAKYNKIANLIFYVIAGLQAFSFLYIKLNRPDAFGVLFSGVGVLSAIMLFGGAILSKMIAEQITKRGLANGFVLVIALMLGYEVIKNIYAIYLGTSSFVEFIVPLMVLIGLFLLALLIQNYSFKIPVVVDIPSNLGEGCQKYKEDKFKLNLMCIGITPIVYFSFVSPLFTVLKIDNPTVLAVVSFVSIYGFTTLAIKSDYKAEDIVDLFISKGITMSLNNASRATMINRFNKLFSIIITFNTLILFAYHMTSVLFESFEKLNLIAVNRINGIQILMLSYVVVEIFATINAYFIKESPELIY